MAAMFIPIPHRDDIRRSAPWNSHFNGVILSTKLLAGDAQDLTQDVTIHTHLCMAILRAIDRLNRPRIIHTNKGRSDPNNISIFPMKLPNIVPI